MDQFELLYRTGVFTIARCVCVCGVTRDVLETIALFSCVCAGCRYSVFLGFPATKVTNSQVLKGRVEVLVLYLSISIPCSFICPIL